MGALQSYESVSDTHVSRMFCSLTLPSLGVSVNLLAPALGGLATGQERVVILPCFVFPKGKAVRAEIGGGGQKNDVGS